MMRPPVSIIIPAFNQAALCRACVASLQRCTPEPHRLILVDNGSTDELGEFFDSVVDADVIHSPKNLGFAGGVNLGLARAEGDVVLLNSDTLLSPGWLTELIGALDGEHAAGMAGPVTNCAAGPQQIDGLCLESEAEIDAYAAARLRDSALGYVPVTRLVGFCLAIRRDVLECVGTLDERFGIGNYEDDDYCARVRQAGYPMVIAERSFVYHHGGKTFDALGITGAKYNALLEENRQKYELKWGVSLPRKSSGLARAALLCDEAEALVNAGEPQEALLRLKAAIEAEPDYGRAYQAMADLLAHGGQEALAEAFRRRAEALRPSQE